MITGNISIFIYLFELIYMKNNYQILCNLPFPFQTLSNAQIVFFSRNILLCKRNYLFNLPTCLIEPVQRKEVEKNRLIAILLINTTGVSIICWRAK